MIRNTHLALCLLVGFAFLLAAPFPVSAQAQSDTATQSEVSTEIEAMVAATDSETSAPRMEIIVVVLTGSELAEVAEAWRGHLRAHLEQAMRVNLEIEKAGRELTGLRDDLASLTVRTDEIVDIYRVVLTAWERKGAAEEDIAPHLEYLSATRTGLVQVTDVATLFGLGMAWLGSWNGGLQVLLKAGILVLASGAMVFVARFVRGATKRVLGRLDAVSQLLASFILRAVYWATLVFGVMVVLALFGVNITPAFAVFGGVSFILGFALQETLGNLASGLMLMVHKPFDTGDYVVIGGYQGFVDKMSVVATRIRTLDNRIVTVPNSKIWGDVITNHTDTPIRRVDLVFGIGYSDDADLATRVLYDIVAEHPKCLEIPEAEVFVGELADNSVNIFCRPWVKSEDYLAVTWDLTGQAKKRFDEVGISIPFPQRDVHLYHETQTEAETS